MSNLRHSNLRYFWDKFHAKVPEKVFQVLPDNPLAAGWSDRPAHPSSSGRGAQNSYEQAYKECCRVVDSISAECERVNQKYTDPYFNLEIDLKSGSRNCLDGLEQQNLVMRPNGVKRVTVSSVIFFFFFFLCIGTALLRRN